jgi:hypothetical protein
MALADTFTTIVESLPDDWTDLELDLRIFEERRYIEASTLLVICNPHPYSKHDWHCACRWLTASGTPPRLRRCTPDSSCSTTPASAVSWRYVRRAPAALRSCRCGAARNRSAKNSGCAAHSKRAVHFGKKAESNMVLTSGFCLTIPNLTSHFAQALRIDGLSAP